MTSFSGHCDIESRHSFLLLIIGKGDDLVDEKNETDSMGNLVGGVEASPMITWETSGEGKKIPIVIFNCGALSKPQVWSLKTTTIFLCFLFLVSF